MTTLGIFQATKPASPIIEDVAPLPGGGLNISWKSDVTSRQEKYIVEFVRNDTGTNETIETATPRVRLQVSVCAAATQGQQETNFERHLGISHHPTRAPMLAQTA